MSWSFPPTVISNVSQNASDPRVAIDASGNAIAVWVENGVVKSRAKPLNMNWDTAVTLSASNASSPRVTLDPSGNAGAVWVESGIVKAATKPFNGSWTTSTALSNSGASSPDLAVSPTGDLVAVWARNGDVESSTKLFGGIWQTRVIINSTGATSPHVAIGGTGSNERAVVVWHGVSGSTNVVYSSTKLLSGSWTSPLALSSISHHAAFADVALDTNANATAVWYQYDVIGTLFSNVVVQSAARLPSGTWTTPVTLSEPGIRDPSTLVARVSYDGNGNAIALWNTSFDDATFNIQSAVQPVQGNWSQATDIVQFNTYAFNTDMAISALGDALALYMFYNGSALMIQSSRSDISGFINNVWSIPTNMSAAANNSNPQVAATLTGNVINAAAVWMSFNGTNNVISSSTGTRTLVQPPSLLSVVQNAQNFGVFTEYYNTVSWQASPDTDVVGYLIYRNGVFLEQVDANTLQFIDHNRVQAQAATYGVSAVNNQNSHSRIISINYP